MARTAEQEATFLKYFLNTYIPPFTHPIPGDAEGYEDVHLSAIEIWDNFGPALPTYSFSNRLKQELVYFFSLCGRLWESYLCAPDDAYKAWVTSPEVKQRWSEIQEHARKIHRTAKSLKYI